IVIHAVLEHNRSPIDDGEWPAEMVTDKNEPSPLNLWNWGIQNRSGLLRRRSVDQVALAVMPRDTARVTPKGIRFKGEFYDCARARRDEWFLRARRKEWTTTVAFDPRDLGRFYLLDQSLRSEIEVCTPIDDHSLRSQVTLFEVEQNDLAQRTVQASAENRLQEYRILTDQRMEDILSKAKQFADSPADRPASQAERLRNIRSNRADEKEIQRGAEAFVLGQTSQGIQEPVSTAEPNDTNIDALNLALLRQNFQRRRAAKGGDTP
ncbi:Mu transposase C-terminal domain-containing protein, partial [Microbacteriaceae bacterium K1510]|nr:Mu transposase C-terminal domain-containing protein [Microbacteriaceae bacterium K1510]